MEATGPIDCDIGRPSTQLASGSEGRSGVHATEVEDICEDRAILDTIEVIDQMSHVVLVTRSDPRSIIPCEECWEPKILMEGETYLDRKSM